MTLDDLTFPIIELHADGFVQVAVDKDILTTTTARLLRRCRLLEITLVDSSLNVVRVTGVKYVCGIGRFWGWTKYLDRIVRAEMELVPVDMSLQDVKKHVLKLLRRSGRSMPRPGEDHKNLLRQVQAASTARELAELILPEFDKRRYMDIIRG